MLVLPKNCAKILRHLTFFSDFEQLSLERASFEQLSEKLQATCGKPYLGDVLQKKNLKFS